MDVLKKFLVFIFCSQFTVSIAHANEESFADLRADSCVYALEQKSDGTQHLMDFVENGISGHGSKQKDLGDFANDFQKHPFFSNFSLTEGIVDKLNEIYLQIPEFAQHLSHHILNTKWVMDTASFKKKIQCNDSMDSSPLNLKNDFVQIPVAFELIHYTRRPSVGKYSISYEVHVDEKRLYTLPYAAQLGVFFSAVLRRTSEARMTGSSPYGQDNLQLRRWTSLLFQNSLARLYETIIGKMPHNIGFFENPKDWKYVWRNCGQTLWPHRSLQVCYKNFAEFTENQRKCQSVESEYAQHMPIVRMILDKMNRTVRDVSKQVYDAKKDLMSTHYMTTGAIPLLARESFVSNPEFGQREEVDGYLMNSAYIGNYRFLQNDHSSYLDEKMKSEIMHGGIYYPRTRIFLTDGNVIEKEVFIDWPDLMDWDQFRKSSESIRRIAQLNKETEYRCDVSLEILQRLRNLHVKESL